MVYIIFPEPTNIHYNSIIARNKKQKLGRKRSGIFLFIIPNLLEFSSQGIKLDKLDVLGQHLLLIQNDYVFLV